jgi:hypothetical protein
MKLFRFAALAATSFVMVAALSAQAPPQQQPPTSPRPEQAPAPRVEQPAAPAAAPRDAAETTIVGCLAQAKDAPDGYTLTVVPAAPAAAEGAAAASAPANTPPDAVRASSSARGDAPRPASADAPSAKAATYKITGIAPDQLKSHVNHHVEIKGRINAAAGAQADAAAAQEFRGSSVKMLNATCPAAQ